MPITREYVERRSQHPQFDTWESFEFRQHYIPERLDEHEDNYEPFVLKYLILKGYLQPPYFDWETRTVTK